MEQVSNTVVSTGDEINGLIAQGWKQGYAAGKHDAAKHILEMWYQPWPITEKRFITNLMEYVEGLK